METVHLKPGEVFTINGEILKVAALSGCKDCCLRATLTCDMVECYDVCFERLGYIWHDPSSEVPENERTLLIQTNNGKPFIAVPNNSNWEDTIRTLGIIRWAYTDDLFLTDKIR